MKKTLSSLLLLFILPISIFKKTKIDNFVGGLLIGAIFSLFVNVLTNQIGEDIARQKSLEALEIELLNHYFQVLHVNDNVNKGLYKKTSIYIYNPYVYNDYVWKSLGSTTFFYSLPIDVQSHLNAYYTTTIYRVNTVDADNNKVVNDYYQQVIACTFERNDCEAEVDLYNKVVTFYTERQDSWSRQVFKNNREVLKLFHPTKDRLSNPLLGFLMGDKALPILTLPWKE